MTKIITEGFINTEIGIVPEDWEVKTFEEIGIVIDGDRGVNYPKDSEFSSDGYCLFLNAKNVTKNGFKFLDCQFITKDKDNKLNKGKLKRQDIILTTRGTVGNIAFYNKNISFDNIRINSGMVILRSILNISQYLSLILNSFIFLKQVEKYVFGSAQPQLTVGLINKILIPLPPTKTEQIAIATVLSDTDNLIQSLEKLIEKKRMIKQGAMQELLKPKEGWEKKKLGELFNVFASNSKNDFVCENGKYIIMDMGAISTEGIILDSKKTDISKDLLALGNLVMPKDDIGGGNIIGKVGYIDKNNGYVLGDHVYKLEIIQHNTDPRFFYYLINSKYINKEFRAKACGSAQLGLNKKSVIDQELCFPKSNEEQTRIALILSTLDLEIESLKKKYSKFKMIKQGLMQELLTGKTRLV